MSNGPDDQAEDDAKRTHGVDDPSTPDDSIAIELPIEQGDADSQPS
ncbi:MAG: hypothetical protein JWL66_2549 [Sphingomonadales bacterium]|jgi:hypothetical protein|nr:hypothetical protein [Sphingomonadales bacterium]